MEKRLAQLKPKVEEFILSPYNGSIQSVITHELCNLTGLTVDELGYQGSTAWLDRKTKKKLILSRFTLSKATLVSGSKFGGSTKLEAIPELCKLNGYFYFGDIKEYFYEVDEDNDSLIIKWHPNLLLAYITDTNLLDSQFSIDYKIIQKDEKKRDKDDHIPAVFIVRKTHSCEGETHYDAEVVKEYFEKLLQG